MTQRTWTAGWIEPAQESTTPEPAYSLYEMFVLHAEPPAWTPPETRLWPAKLMKRGFVVADKPVRRATLHMTARGVYQAYVNGELVSDALFAPDYTTYDHLLMYQTYDVSGLVRAGENVWGVILADGWYAGRISQQGNGAQYGDRLSIMGELEVEYADGTSELVRTDAEWRSTTGKYVYSDIQIGEKQDLRLEDKAWASTAVAEGWDEVAEVAAPAAELVAQVGPQVRRREVLDAVKAWPEGDAIVVDFGQVIAGRCRIECDLAEGQELRLEHAEVLDAEGRFFMNIIGRNKDAADAFVGRGGHEVLEPDFTFHGFRYVRLSGWDEAAQGTFDPACIKAVVIYSDLRETGRIRTSDARVNRLLDNILWSQRGNMLSIPTDCPQRERAGWTGDIQVYAPTGCFFMDLHDFLVRWLDQVMADQLDDGQVVDYSPATKDLFASGEFLGAISSSGWGDAIVLVPWQLYREYGDREVLERCYDSMMRWHDFCVKSAAGAFLEEGEKEGDARYIWDTKFNYGDWMLPSYVMGNEGAGPIEAAAVTAPTIATAWLAHVSDVLADISELLGHGDAAAEQRAYAAEVRRAFADRFWDGKKLDADFQGCYVDALAFDMLPEAERAAAADRLVELIHANGDKLDTGFLSVSYLLDVLWDFGHEDVAETLLWQDGCPSWLYEVDRGGTTVWENWGAIASDGTVGALSFNHYAFGCVGDWIVRKVGGLALREPAWAEFDVVPAFVRGFESCELEHETAAGTIRVAWSGSGAGAREVRVSVPEGCRAHVALPGSDEVVVGAGEHVFAC
ncbi:family 78 glycoside hydrolase catalytic domain [Paratractidigestivibacter sp.]|uniref:family 78 glycoside hydrolase catalytic domain n=1 Tax=Paratractidigestivibacter sp. TaxID=2847316 RepID=UPI002AC9675E|nr:family 78 glycoside hydrolase catalytic domain [Paratractidigestivibacter sp.]